ncbi:MAG TPA: vWA domain-containing protein [Methylophilaceae bacterium]|nr:vWA domain-containing protein [Methylophilaceae bacterium]
MSLHYPWALLLLPLALVPLWLQRQQGQIYSWVALAPKDPLSDMISLLLRYLAVAIIACMVFALAGPQGAATHLQRTGKGAQIVLVIDRSASMDDPFAGAGLDSDARNIGETKARAAKRLITRFVNERKDDMVGVVTFSNSAMHVIPLTQSREAIHAAISAAGGSGLLQTNIGAGLTSGVAMFEKMPDSGSRAIVLLSDGAGRITPKAKQKISDWMARQHVNLYWIVLRQPDGISIFNTSYQLSSDYQTKDGLEPAEIELHKFFQTLKVKYQAYEAEDPKTLQSAIHDINLREKNPIRYNVNIPGRDYSPYFIILAACLIALLLLIKFMGIRSWQQA